VLRHPSLDPVRTFSNWGDPPPGFISADLVAHSGPITSGAFLQTLVLTDIATARTECAPLLMRKQTRQLSNRNYTRQVCTHEVCFERG
jgi:hypothetical protein